MNRLNRIAIWTGGIALLSATAIDSVAVIGRHTGLPLTGSIELMQAAVLVSGALGLVIATLDGVHARVQLLVDRLPQARRVLADRLSDLLTLLFVAALLAGSLWLAADLWGGHEQSELLGVPWWLLRAMANACLLAMVLILARRVLRKRAG